MFETIKIILKLIPLLLDIIRVVETQIPEGGKGKDKLQFIREVLLDVYPDIQNSWTTVEKIIGSIVELYNKTGVFKK